MDQFLVLIVVAGTTPVNVPALLQMSLEVCKKLQDLFGCVKTAKRVEKNFSEMDQMILMKSAVSSNSLKNEYCILNKSLRTKSI